VLLVGDWRDIFLALAAIGALLLAATAIVTEETLPPEERRSRAVGETFASIRVLLRHRPYMSFVLSGAFGFGAMFAYISASAFVYQEVFGMSAQLYAVLFAVNGLAVMSANLVNARLVGRSTPEPLLRRGLIALCLGASILAVAIVLSAGAVVVLPIVLLTVASVGFVVSNSITLAMAGEASRAGAASALFGLFQFAVGAGIAPLVGIAGSSAVPMGLAMAGCALIAMLTYRTLGPTPGASTVDASA